MTIALGASDPRHEHMIPPVTSNNWVTAWGAWVPSGWAPVIAERLISEGYAARPQGNTIQIRQDKNNMPSTDAVKERVLAIRGEMMLADQIDFKEVQV